METKKIFHWFWAWQDEREEAWLSEMAAQGWHLQIAGAFCNYTFTQGEPRQVAYRLDFFIDPKNKAHYFQMFQDAGWEHVGEAGTWQYFRKPVTDGEAPEIYTDAASKIAKYQRILVVLVALMPIFILLPQRLNQAEGWFYQAAALVAFAVYLGYLYAIVKLVGRVSQLKKSQR
jgi:hypothetical protein